MPAIPSNQLINEIIYAIQESGGIASYVSENAITHPRKFVFSFLGNSYSLWVYIWTLTPGGRVTLPDEYRIQMTGVSSPLQKNPEGLTVLMGYYPDLKIFAGFDITKHSQFTAGSPSVQIDISAIYSALQHGLSFVKKDNNEIAIGFRPDLFLTYCLNGKVLHLYGAQSNITEILTQAVELQEVSQKEFSSLPANRKRIIQKVSKYSRDANFRKIVLNAYDNRCAVTRTQLRLVDAAHILPVASRESSDDITNGIALSPTFHRAYDHCLIYLDENYVMKLNTEKSEELTSQNLVDGLPDFKRFLDKKIHLPLDVNQRPNVQLIEIANKHRRIPGYL